MDFLPSEKSPENRGIPLKRPNFLRVTTRSFWKSKGKRLTNIAAEAYFARAGDGVLGYCAGTEGSARGRGTISDEGYCLWLLRSMTSVSNGDQGAAFMNGTLDEVGYVEHGSGVMLAKEGSGMPAFCDYLCVVRPAMWVDPATANIAIAAASGEAVDAESAQEAASVHGMSVEFSHRVCKTLPNSAVRQSPGGILVSSNGF